MIRRALLACLCAGPAMADTLVAARTIPAGQVIAEGDLLLRGQEVPGALTDKASAVGQEARVALYAGRPIRAGDLGAPAVVERNETLPLIYENGAITITTEGRALDRAGLGDMLDVMNISSRTTVRARIGPDGGAYVTP
ncbi:flagellar basal body P-ring formation chaperone FlgA [Pseudoroseicyclus aestuarii]|uniref:Flagella basal body P-ring formation protein FlgA n=1 Tax=Pseudoroseicyclus aestuarii TaxID=1795041 RepID=A0A318SSA0_9RHOB|nr:flagellar basal body P-ring formation chaperone FlgA [Pseudoroseicyclus aestuarii]PYE84583.1 flagella basal body P-ring formation protein FlgA [Pseudoroseicyclus aestuarii]